MLLFFVPNIDMFYNFSNKLAQVHFVLEEKLRDAFSDVVDWLSNHGLEVAVSKTEAIVLMKRNSRNTMCIKYRGHRFQS